MTLDVVRWIGCLPVAVAAAWLAWIVVNILGRFSLGFVGIGPDDFQGKLYFMTAGHAAMGVAFVYVGAKIAPCHRVLVAFVLGGIGIIVAGFLLFPAVMVRDWWAVWGGLLVAIGAGAVVYAIHAGETDIE
jgi:hypothetical protein